MTDRSGLSSVPPSGTIVDREHRFPARVYFADTDAAGIVYHAAYLTFAERARTEWMRLIGYPHARMMNPAGQQDPEGDLGLRIEGAVFAVRKVTLDYRRPARLDDLLEIRSRVARFGGASMTVRQDVCRGDAVLVEIELLMVCVNAAGRPVRIPDQLRAAMGHDPGGDAGGETG